jgi:hypothetical protein
MNNFGTPKIYMFLVQNFSGNWQGTDGTLKKNQIVHPLQSTAATKLLYPTPPIANLQQQGGPHGPWTISFQKCHC